MADIPGLIEGAAEGAGLGIQFLRHLQRTGLLLHLVDIAPIDVSVDPAESVRALERELASFSEDLAAKPRWLVINKIDLLDDESLGLAKDDLLQKLDWNGQVFEVSAATGEGTEALGHAIMQELEASKEAAPRRGLNPARRESPAIEDWSDQKKCRFEGGIFLFDGRQSQTASALTRLFMRLLCLAALFLLTMPLLTMLSITGTAAL